MYLHVNSEILYTFQYVAATIQFNLYFVYIASVTFKVVFWSLTPEQAAVAREK